MTPKAKATKAKTTTTKQPAAPKKRASAPAKESGGPTLADVAAGYLNDLEQRGSSESTISGYRAELKAAARMLGENTPVSEITIADVQRYFESDAVTKTRVGEPRSTRTIDRSRRVLRLCLWHAEETGVLAKAPISDDGDPREEASAGAAETAATSTEGAVA